MKRIVSIALLSLLLAACNPQKPELIRTQWKVVLPDQSMYQCPQVNQLPRPKTLTDLQVATLITELYKNNKICKNSIEGIKKFLDEARKQIEAGNAIY